MFARFFLYIQYILKILVYTVLVHTVYTYSTIETRKYEGGYLHMRKRIEVTVVVTCNIL